MAWLKYAIIVVVSAALSMAEESAKEPRVSLFDVVRFKNEACASGSTTYNGTCYTKEECQQKGGTSSGSCASGYGVCCLFVMSCGSTSSENSTYIVQASTTSLTNPCTYTLCPFDSSICRIRFDFSSLVLAGPTSGTITAIGTGAANTQGDGLGDCVTDTFSITSPGSTGTPVICGFNSGQHMIVDANTACHKANFKIGSTTGTNRQWSIKVTQYSCGDDTLLGGPPGCLQYFTGNTGTISSFNFDTTSTTIATTTTNLQHLSNQCYEVCIRRNSGRCSICYWVAQAGSFGVSIPLGTAVTSAINLACTSDYVYIPGAMTAANAAIATTTVSAAERICGRLFNLDVTATVPGTICSKMTPFRLTFKADDSEITTSNAATMANTNELNGQPSGTVGFSLAYSQIAC